MPTYVTTLRWIGTALFLIGLIGVRSIAFAQSDEESGLEAEAESAATQPARAQVRPDLGDAAEAALAAALREAYSKPPEQWPPMVVDEGVEAKELGLMPKPVFPEHNPFSKEKALLGRMLFFDPRLSRTKQMACASCHDPDLGWSDGRTVSFGHDRKALKRNAPTVMNSGYASSLFVDGRAATLESQAVMVLTNSDEMHTGGSDVVESIQAIAGYKAPFAAAFGDEEVTFPRVTQSIATFLRTVTAGRSRFDLFLRGRHDALTDEAVRGLHLFRTTAKCMNCHSGPNFSDDKFHDLGLSYYGRKLQDLGRYEITKDPKDVGAFRTPTLRNVMRTRPYMHVGLFEMEGVLNLYNAGMPTLRRKPDQQDDPLFPVKSPLLHPLGLNRRDLADLKAFMESLTEPKLGVRPPALPE